jgi:hypothetical protein
LSGFIAPTEPVFEKSTQLGALGGPGCWVGDPATQHPAKF